MRNAGTAQAVEIGWWPGDARYGKAAFYAYAYPVPSGFAGQARTPSAARWDGALGEYILDWDDIRAHPDPHAAALEFARSAFRHAFVVCGWDPGRESAKPADRKTTSEPAALAARRFLRGQRWPRGRCSPPFRSSLARASACKPQCRDAEN
jgi:hypothetical protein